MRGGAGEYSLTGGVGADSFILDRETGSGVAEPDLTTDYCRSYNDVVDLSASSGMSSAQAVAGICIKGSAKTKMS